MRKHVVEKMENGKLTQMHLANVLGKLEKIKLWMTRTGEAYHAQECHFTKPPHSHSALQYRACGECLARAVRAMLVSSDVTTSSGMWRLAWPPAAS